MKSPNPESAPRPGQAVVRRDWAVQASYTSLALLTLSAVITWLLRGGGHDVRTMPYSGQPVCLQCGSRRDYEVGKKPGRWHS